MKTAIGILVALSIALAVGLYLRHKNAVDQKAKDEARILQLSKSWEETSAKLNDQVATNASLNNRLQQKAGELETTAKLLEDTKVTLAKAEADARAAAKAAEAEIAKREAKIAELESQNLALDKQAGDLKSAIGTLESKIADTEKKLAASEGDREFLLKELKRLQAEKAELERKFNDLIVLREQVRKLKDELDVARRLDWIKKGLLGGAGLKGGPLLQRGFGRGAAGDTNFGLNVELKRDGGAKITTPTNAPPAQNK